MESALETVNRFYGTTNNRDADGVGRLVADDIRFVGPLMATTGAEAYVEINRQLLPSHLAMRMKGQFENGDQVCSIYEMDLRTPDGGSLTVEMADWITVTDGKISSQRIYYDPRKFAEAFGM